MLIYLQLCRHFRDCDHVRCIKGYLMAPGPKLLHHFWSYRDVLETISSPCSFTAQQHFTAVDSVGHMCACGKKRTE